jgi:RNA polymerase sigma-70 factor, ECF subfamily
MQATSASHRATLDGFYRRHSTRVLRWMIRLGGPHVDPEDAAQEVFITAFRRFDTYDSKRASETAWLYGIARRVVANARRRAFLRRCVGLSTLGPVASPGPTTDAMAQALCRRRQLQYALEQLNSTKREVLVLVDLEEHSAPEVARMLGLPVGTVYSRLHHARTALRMALETQAASTTPTQVRTT